jgi:hypothetical protein
MLMYHTVRSSLVYHTLVPSGGLHGVGTLLAVLGRSPFLLSTSHRSPNGGCTGRDIVPDPCDQGEFPDCLTLPLLMTFSVGERLVCTQVRPHAPLFLRTLAQWYPPHLLSDHRAYHPSLELWMRAYRIVCSSPRLTTGLRTTYPPIALDLVRVSYDALRLPLRAPSRHSLPRRSQGARATLDKTLSRVRWTLERCYDLYVTFVARRAWLLPSVVLAGQEFLSVHPSLLASAALILSIRALGSQVSLSDISNCSNSSFDDDDSMGKSRTPSLSPPTSIPDPFFSALEFYDSSSCIDDCDDRSDVYEMDQDEWEADVFVMEKIVVMGLKEVLGVDRVRLPAPDERFTDNIAVEGDVQVGAVDRGTC